MKQLIFSLIVPAVLFLMGCSENSITEPIYPTDYRTMNKAQIHDGAEIRGSIPLEGILVLPILFNSYYAIDGQIDYTLEVAEVGPGSPQGNTELNLSVKAILTDDIPGKEYYISEETEEVLNIPQDDILKLEKSFSVQGSIKGLKLVCRLLVSRASVTLDARWLSLVEDEAQGNGTEYNAPIIEDNRGDDIQKCIILPNLPDWPSAYFVIEQATIRDDIISLIVSYSGGCRPHGFQLVCTTFQESYPLQVLAQVFHNRNGDPCDQWVTEEKKFDLSPLKELYLSIYDDPCNEIIINFADLEPDNLALTYDLCGDSLVPPRPPLPWVCLLPNNEDDR